MLDEQKVRNILIQLGAKEDQITQDLIEEILMNCERTFEVIEYVTKNKLIQIGNATASSGSGGNDTLKGFLIGCSRTPRFDGFRYQDGSIVMFKDYSKIVYVKDDNLYVLTDGQGNFIIDESGNVKTVTPIEYYIGYLLTEDKKLVLVKSKQPLPEPYCFVKLKGRNTKVGFFIGSIKEQRNELTEFELNFIYDYIEEQNEKMFELLNKECKTEPLVFIGRVAVVREDPDKGVLGRETVFAVNTGGEKPIWLPTDAVEWPVGEGGMFLGLLNSRKSKKSGNMMRRLIHVVKLR